MWSTKSTIRFCFMSVRLKNVPSDPAGGLKQGCFRKASSEQSGPPLPAPGTEPGTSAVLLWLLLAHGSGLPALGSSKFSIYLRYCHENNQSTVRSHSSVSHKKGLNRSCSCWSAVGCLPAPTRPRLSPALQADGGVVHACSLKLLL